MTTAVDDSVELLDDSPTKAGWYATVACWEVREGLFPGAHYWNGEQWRPYTRASIQYWSKIFETEKEAEDFAYEHDLER